MKYCKFRFFKNNYLFGDESDEAIFNEIVTYNVNSLSSLIACYLVRLDEQFFGRC